MNTWLLRVLIDEALGIFHENQETAQGELGFPKDSSEHEINCTITNCAAEKTAQKESLEMSTQSSIKSSQERNHHEQRITPNGTLFEFLVPPDKAKHEVCLIRGTIPPGAAVPLHSHAEVEIFYVLEGAVEAFQSSDGSPRWITVRAGDTVTIPGNTKHALRNSSPLSSTMVVVTTSKLYEFFQEVTKPFDPNQSATPPTPAEIQEFFRVVAKYGYWMGSLEENAAIGLTMG